MMREISFRFVLTRGGADVCELQAVADSAPMLRMSDSGQIKTSFSGVFALEPRADWLTDEIRPELILDGVSYPLGVFLPATVTEETGAASSLLHIEAYDRCWLVRDNYTGGILSLAAGTNYLAAVKQLLTTAGVALVIETPTTATLSETREDWEIGTSYLQIVNELLTEINYKPLWFNAQGAAVLEPVRVPAAENIQHTLDANDVQSLLLPDRSRKTDVYSAPNVFLCICANPDKDATLTATAVNDNPQSPLSVARRGRRIMRVEQLNNIASQSELDAYAAHLRNLSMYTGETIEAATAIFPGWGVDDVTAITLPEISAICKETAWSMELKVGGAMKHTLERVVLALG